MAYADELIMLDLKYPPRPDTSQWISVMNMDSRSLKPSRSNCGYTTQKSLFVGVLSGHTFEARSSAQSVMGRQLQGRSVMFAIEMSRST